MCRVSRAQQLIPGKVIDFLATSDSRGAASVRGTTCPYLRSPDLFLLLKVNLVNFYGRRQRVLKFNECYVSPLKRKRKNLLSIFRPRSSASSWFPPPFMLRVTRELWHQVGAPSQVAKSFIDFYSLFKSHSQPTVKRPLDRRSWFVGFQRVLGVVVEGERLPLLELRAPTAIATGPTTHSPATDETWPVQLGLISKSRVSLVAGANCAHKYSFHTQWTHWNLHESVHCGIHQWAGSTNQQRASTTTLGRSAFFAFNYCYPPTDAPTLNIRFHSLCYQTPASI